MRRTTPRRARRHHLCGCGKVIRQGDRYLEHVASPDDGDLGNTMWLRLPECEACAVRYGRLTPVTEGGDR